jgi:hypothetical protein
MTTKIRPGFRATEIPVTHPAATQATRKLSLKADGSQH